MTMDSRRRVAGAAGAALLALLLVEAAVAVRVSTGNAEPRQQNGADDQQASASYWQDANLAAAAGQAVAGGTAAPGFNGANAFRQLNFRQTASKELKNNPHLSSPWECARACREKQMPRVCYYHFTLEMYTVLGAACQLCTPNATNTIQSNCQCVLADGVERTILTANRQLPGPSIQVCEGDKVIVDVENHIEGMEVTIHWHGLFQRETPYYDGVPFVTQCPIQQGNTFRYQWIPNAGTHFWHAHTGLQKFDGLHGSIIVRQSPKRDPNSKEYDFDLTKQSMLFSDWLHEPAMSVFPGRLAVNTGQAPTSLLINGKGQYRDPNTGFTTNTPLEVFTITPGRRYRFRMINSFSSVCPLQLTIEGHVLRVIATDGEPVHPVDVNTIVSFSAERYDFVITADQTPRAYWIQARALGECGIRRVQQLGVLRYARGPYQPSTTAPTYDVGLPQGVVLNPLDNTCYNNNGKKNESSVCLDDLRYNGAPKPQRLYRPKADHTEYIRINFMSYATKDLFKTNNYAKYIVLRSGRASASTLNGIEYKTSASPLLSQYKDVRRSMLFCNETSKPTYCGNYNNCTCLHVINLPLYKTVELVIVDEARIASLRHPIHLHGFNFAVLKMGVASDFNVTDITRNFTQQCDDNGLIQRNLDRPLMKDTISVPGNGYVVLRFFTDNPGFWFLHCHFLPHIMNGMSLTFKVGEMKDMVPVPTDFPRCGNYLPDINLPARGFDGKYRNFYDPRHNKFADPGHRSWHSSHNDEHFEMDGFADLPYGGAALSSIATQRDDHFPRSVYEDVETERPKYWEPTKARTFGQFSYPPYRSEEYYQNVTSRYGWNDYCNDAEYATTDANSYMVYEYADDLGL